MDYFDPELERIRAALIQCRNSRGDYGGALDDAIDALNRHPYFAAAREAALAEMAQTGEA